MCARGVPAQRAAREAGDFGLNTTKESAKRTAARLATASKLIGGMAKDGKVKIVAAVYDLTTGEVGWLG